MHLIIYDGDCLFCNSFIKQIIRSDNGLFYLKDRNSADFEQLIREYRIQQGTAETIYLVQDGKVFEKSTAIYKILLCCRGIKKIMGQLLRMVPSFLRDKLYSFVAKHRKRLGTKTCSLPDAELKKRYI